MVVPSIGDRILAEVGAYYEIAPAAMLARSRKDRATLARHMAAWLRRKLDKHSSLAEIGDWLGGRDHTTAMNSIERAELERERDPEFRGVSDAILARLQESRAAFVAATWPTFEADIQRAALAATDALHNASRGRYGREAA